MQDEVMNDLHEVYTDPNPGDLLRVTRCRDCVYYAGKQYGDYGKCDRNNTWMRTDSYCSDGVRRDG